MIMNSSKSADWLAGLTRYLVIMGILVLSTVDLLQVDGRQNVYLFMRQFGKVRVVSSVIQMEIVSPCFLRSIWMHFVHRL